MARNDARSLAEAVLPRSCIIVGSGPSARHAPLWKRLEQDPTLTTVACNGALSVFMDHGIAPTYWSCCDPQDEVLDFIPPNPPTSTTYLVATKCLESLFEKLSTRTVRLWRLDDMRQTPNAIHIPTAVSITLVTMNLMRFMGFHRFETYGWDCCYLDGQHHASHQPEPPDAFPFEIQDGATDEVLHSFTIVPAWAAELNDAAIQAHNYKAMGYELTVHGPGAVGTLLRAKGLIAKRWQPD